MSWKRVPNEVVVDFTGRPLKSLNRDGDLEVVYKQFRCPDTDCVDRTTGERPRFRKISDYQDHARERHDGPEEVAITAETHESTAGDCILELLMRLDNQTQENPLRSVRKTGDAYHAQEVWRRVQLAQDDGGPIKLREKQYDWLHGLIDRKLPQPKEKSEDNRPEETVAMHIWALASDSVQQTLLTPGDRRVSDEPDDEDEDQSEDQAQEDTTAEDDGHTAAKPEPNGRAARRRAAKSKSRG